MDMDNDGENHRNNPQTRGRSPAEIVGIVVMWIVATVLLLPFILGLLYGLLRPAFG